MSFNSAKSLGAAPIVTVAVPSMNQGRYLTAALQSIVGQNIPMEIMLLDGGSTDETLDVINAWQAHLFYTRSHKDDGQAAAINEGISHGTAPFVCWLNSDDVFLPGGLRCLYDALNSAPHAAAVYGRCAIVNAGGRRIGSYRTRSFSADALSRRCFIAQPATLIRREAWDRIGGLNSKLHFAMDYELWWRLLRDAGPLEFANVEVAASRFHMETKTQMNGGAHYDEVYSVLQEYVGEVPLVWRLKRPLSVGVRQLATRLSRLL